MPMVVCISSESSGTRHKTIGSFLLFYMGLFMIWLKMDYYISPPEHVKV